MAGASLSSVAGKILDIIGIFPKLLIALALAYFLYGLTGYLSGIDEKKKKEARDVMFYGIIGLFVMVSTLGIINVIIDALGLKP